MNPAVITVRDAIVSADEDRKSIPCTAAMTARAWMSTGPS
jgi:hypothetical protein